MTHELSSSRKEKRGSFGSCDYKGPPLEWTKCSILEQFEDDARALGFSQILESETMPVIRQVVQKFIGLTMKNMTKAKYDSAKAASLADKMKEDDKLAQSLLQSIFSNITREDGSWLNNLVYTPNGCVGYSICSSCPYYLKSKICLIGQRELFGETYQEIVFDERFNLSSSVLMVRLLFNVFHYIVTHIDMKDLIRYKVLLEDLQTVMGLYKSMNPTGDVIRQQEDKLLGILTRPKQELSVDEEALWLGIIESVKEDILYSQKPYVREMQKCRSTIQKEMAIGYQNSDYYMSMKATPQTVEGKGKKRKSLLNSVLERDTFLEHPATQAFDALVGYQSHYVKVTPTRARAIITMLIQNSGKFNMRGIHLAENAIQDRCNFLHRIWSKGLHSMSTDCSRNQDNGRRFARLLTMRWYLSNADRKIGIYCLDFSNATDTMSQEFQEDILAFMSDPIIANYWGMLSRAPKLFIRSDLSEVRYTQIAGQPQGLLGSFDAFSIAHHFMMLMTMKFCGLEEYDSVEFYRILGDDSILNTIEPEIDFPDDLVLETYKRICTFANFTVNDDKGVYTHHHSPYALASFAKVEFMNGTNFSPTPYRLAANYLTPNIERTQVNQIAVALWRGNVGYPGYSEFLDVVTAKSQWGPWVNKALRSGMIPYFECFRDPSKEFSEEQKARAEYCLSLSILNSTMMSILMGDRELNEDNPKESFHSFDDLFEYFPEEDLDAVPIGHKINLVLDSNARIDKFYADVLSLDNLDDKCLRLASELITRGVSKDYSDELVNLLEIVQVHELIKQCNDKCPEFIPVLLPEIRDSTKDFLKEVNLGLMTRGLTKSPTRISYILSNAYKAYLELGESLGILPEDMSILESLPIQ